MITMNFWKIRAKRPYRPGRSAQYPAGAGSRGGQILILVLLLGSSSVDARDRVQVRVSLQDGQVLRGDVTVEEFNDWTTDDMLSLYLGDAAAPINIPAESVSAVEGVRASAGSHSFRNPSSSRYFYAPSALPLAAGEGYISQKELMLTAAAYGLTDHIAVSAGTALPVLLSRDFVTDVGVPFELGLKAAAPVADSVYVSAGLESIAAVGPDSAGVLFAWGSGTVGDEDHNLTLGGGGVWILGDVPGNWGVPVVLAGMTRRGNHWGIVSESWSVIVPNESMILFASSAGARFLPDQDGRWSIDTALIALGYMDYSAPVQMDWVPLPLPWIDFTWYFSTQ